MFKREHGVTPGRRAGRRVTLRRAARPDSGVRGRGRLARTTRTRGGLARDLVASPTPTRQRRPVSRTVARGMVSPVAVLVCLLAAAAGLARLAAGFAVAWTAAGVSASAEPSCVAWLSLRAAASERRSGAACDGRADAKPALARESSPLPPAGLPRIQHPPRQHGRARARRPAPVRGRYPPPHHPAHARRHGGRRACDRGPTGPALLAAARTRAAPCAGSADASRAAAATASPAARPRAHPGAAPDGPGAVAVHIGARLFLAAHIQETTGLRLFQQVAEGAEAVGTR